MPSFIELLKQQGDISFSGMRKVALSMLLKDKAAKNRLYEELKRGTCILDDDDHLNMYLFSFGKMHKAKLDTAFSNLDYSEMFSEDVDIYDWGCGQGTATVCLLDYLNEKGIHGNIRTINLIDPSTAATKRASDIIHCYGDYSVKTITKGFDDLNKNDFEIRPAGKVFHLFSNILDVDVFDLAQFTYLFQNLFSGSNYFVCVGPYYSKNKRVDEFIAAIEPDSMYAIMNKGTNEWKNEWSIALRVFFKEFRRIETIKDIRKRIEEFHKKDQYFAGYILDAIAEEIKGTELEKENEGLYKSLSAFDVVSNIPLNNYSDCDSKLAVLANIISRGLPTKAPVLVEDIFSELFQVSVKPSMDVPLDYASTHRLDAYEINEALHVIDPRFKLDNYNGDILESDFEKSFVEKYLKGTNIEYLIQILEPQRPLSTIVDIPFQDFSKDQRVDFSMEIPYGDSKIGFIVELDGQPYHSSIFQRLRDERRDRLAASRGYDTYRIEQLWDVNFLRSWNEETTSSKYLSILRRNYSKTLDGKWNETLQMVLSPLAIARVERMLVEAMMSGALDVYSEEWNIVVVERDVPCAAIAFADLQEKYQHICDLAEAEYHWPNINLTIVSTQEFCSSPLHLGNHTMCEMPSSHFDFCLDISMLLRDNIDALPLSVEADTFYIVRSSHYKKRERTICTAENIVYPDMTTKDTTGTYHNIEEREKILTYFLKEIFRKPSFREGQLPILSHALADKTTIGLLPTGGGKSLTYQLSCMLQPGVTIIVDPLVSLMVDQVRGLNELRIDACDCVHSSGLNAKEKAKKLNLLQSGAVQMMLLSPERYMMNNFRESLVAMTERNHISFAYGVIDEVHCVSEWGHDFRPAYLHLGRNMINYMRTKSGHPISIIGLTATASFDVLADVERELTLGGNLTIDSEAIVRPESDKRPELTYRIVSVLSDFDEIKDSARPYLLNIDSDWGLKDIVAKSKKRVMFDLLEKIPADIQDLNDTHDICQIKDFSPEDFYSVDENNKYPNAGIIFCPHARGTFGVLDNIWGTRQGISTDLLADKPSLSIGTFVGGDKPLGDMKRFNENSLNLMVATKAFGMGIDKPNIRFAINFNHPSSLESYVQEAGRAGRDRKHAISYILFEDTEYIHLTADKVNDIRLNMGTDDPRWLEHYLNKFVLLRDIPELCSENNATEEQTKSIINIIKAHGYLENVDKNIDLWFHNNSFRGLYKEKVILTEMTDRILNVKPTYLVEVQQQLRDIVGNNDICLKADLRRNAIKVYSEEESRRQYGFIFLDTLTPTYRYVDFDTNTCHIVSEALIDILKTYDDYSARSLLHPLEGEDNITEGIYSVLADVEKDDYVYVTVSWDNQIKQDPEEFERSIKKAISAIAQNMNWQDIDENRCKLDVNKIGDFDELLGQIYRCSGDTRWLRNHGDEDIYKKLRMAFCKKRDKDDTDKAIYRMCCIGLVEDVTIDYLSQTYELKIRKRSDDEYKQNMLDFFRKYYSMEQAKTRVSQIDSQRGRNYLDKCMGYLTGFVYDNLEKKRLRAIDDMRVACEESIIEREKNNNDEWLKQFIHLYFNSKYARTGYQVDGKNYSLMEDTDIEGLDGFNEVVLKYIDIVSKDKSGSEIDNVKHLYGATLLCLRAHPDNPALQLLLTYCITFLGAGSNETMKSNALNGYIEGFLSYHKKGPEVWAFIDQFNQRLQDKVHDEDVFIKERIIKDGKNTVMLIAHEKRVNDIADKYLGRSSKGKVETKNERYVVDERNDGHKSRKRITGEKVYEHVEIKNNNR